MTYFEQMQLTAVLNMGGDLGGTEGNGPPKFEVGMTHAYVSPNTWETGYTKFII